MTVCTVCFQVFHDDAGPGARHIESLGMSEASMKKLNAGNASECMIVGGQAGW